jgi:hypothetical protein
MTTPRAVFAAVLTSLLLALPASAPASAATLRLGVYDCQAYNSYSGYLDYKGSVKLRSGGRYQQSYGRHGTKLTKPKGGKYVIRRSKIKFTSGPNRKTPGQIKPADSSHKFAFWNVLVDGKNSGVSCYFVSKP